MLCLLSFVAVVFFLFKTISVLRRLRQVGKQRQDERNGGQTVAFFHPYCDAGGGGERVLWCAVRAMQNKYPQHDYVVYTGDLNRKPDDILRRVQENFKITLPSAVRFVFLHRRSWVEAERYPFITMLGQSLGSIWLGLEALNKCVPDVFVDSMGYSFVAATFKLLVGCKVVCYVHYPTISTDMLQVVAQGQATFNNRSFISRNPFLTKFKFIYYKIFAFLYGLTGRTADVVMVNSSWTKSHINELWGRPEKTFLVYPPCNVDEFKKLNDAERNKFQVISIAQFRPEKNHNLQLEAFRSVVKKLPSEDAAKAQLLLVGSCRNEEDDRRVEHLKKLSEDLNIDKNVQFKINISFEELLNLMRHSSIGLHTMINEHFGIGVVECLAAGLITIAHNSAGPKMDIITDPSYGFLANDAQSFADKIFEIIKMPKDEVEKMRNESRRCVDRFSEKEFESKFLDVIQLIV